VGVPFVAADLVDGALSEMHHLERIKADLGLRDGVADRFGVAAAHVDRDRPDRGLAGTELVEEALQGGGVAACRAPHDRPSFMVDDACEVALAAAVADLVDTDSDEALQAGLVEMVGDDAGDDLSDGVGP